MGEVTSGGTVQTYSPVPKAQKSRQRGLREGAGTPRGLDRWSGRARLRDAAGPDRYERIVTMLLTRRTAGLHPVVSSRPEKLQPLKWSVGIPSDICSKIIECFRS